MKRITLAVLVAALAGVIGLTLNFDRSVPVGASPATFAKTEPVMYGAADALVLSCMDYRLTDEIAEYFQHDMGLADKYDYVILAGASLGVNNTKYPNWGKTFYEHLDTAIALHHVHQVIIMDHRNCGAYKLLLNKDFPEDSDAAKLKEETAVHKEQLDALAKSIHEKYAELDVKTLLMSLDGSVDQIGEIKGTPKAGDKH